MIAFAIALLADGNGAHPASGRVEADGLGARRFAELSGATTNRCDLGAAEVRSMPVAARLEGACCSPMNRDQYERQLRGIRRTDGSALILADPYDVSVALEKRPVRIEAPR